MKIFKQLHLQVPENMKFLKMTLTKGVQKPLH